jgi:hypothetical protein
MNSAAWFPASPNAATASPVRSPGTGGRRLCFSGVWAIGDFPGELRPGVLVGRVPLNPPTRFATRSPTPSVWSHAIGRVPVHVHGLNAGWVMRLTPW